MRGRCVAAWCRHPVIAAAGVGPCTLTFSRGTRLKACFIFLVQGIACDDETLLPILKDLLVDKFGATPK